MPTTSPSPPPSRPDPYEGEFWPALLHRWFVQYNPLYLSSAALVMGGMAVVSREAARTGSTLGTLGVGAIAELYALALIGSAALLTRRGERRPAVMLGLLAVLYQCDLTLHLETCAYLGVLGVGASAMWWGLFVAKLFALAAALQLRLSRTAWLVPSLSALGLAVMPHVLRAVGPDARTTLIALFVFAVGAAGLSTSRAIESAVPVDVRGVRALRATWALFAALTLAHALYWAATFGGSAGPVLAAVALLGTRVVRRERSVFVIVLGTLAHAAFIAPESLSLTAAMASVALVLRAVRAPLPPVESDAPTGSSPYRGVVSPPRSVAQVARFGRTGAGETARLVVGALLALHLSLWTLGWSSGGWPAHILALDLALTAACLGLAVWRRRPLLLAPTGALYAHLAVEVGALPSSTMQWGLTAIGGGFALLAVGLLATWRRRDGEPAGR